MRLVSVNMVLVVFRAMIRLLEGIHQSNTNRVIKMEREIQKMRDEQQDHHNEALRAVRVKTRLIEIIE